MRPWGGRRSARSHAIPGGARGGVNARCWPRRGPSAEPVAAGPRTLLTETAPKRQAGLGGRVALFGLAALPFHPPRIVATVVLNEHQCDVSLTLGCPLSAQGRCSTLRWREHADQTFRSPWARRESNPHARRPQGLSPLCLPFHHAPRVAVCHSDRRRAGYPTARIRMGCSQPVAGHGGLLASAECWRS